MNHCWVQFADLLILVHFIFDFISFNLFFNFWGGEITDTFTHLYGCGHTTDTAKPIVAA